MVRIREFELAAMDLFKRGQVKGTVHPYIGRKPPAWASAWRCARTT